VLAGADVTANQIVEGRVIRIDERLHPRRRRLQERRHHPRNEWEEGDELPKVGDTFRVLVEDTEDIAGQHEIAE